MTRWNPWRALRERPHIIFRLAPLETEYGYIEDNGDGTRTIVVADDLDVAGRNAVLDHELAHDEMDTLYDEDTLPAIVEKYEYWTQGRSTARLIPMDELIEWADRTKAMNPIRAEEVAEHFETTLDVALDALRRMPAF